MTTSRLQVGMIALIVAVSLQASLAQDQSAAAQKSAAAWLALIDSERYAESWQAAAAAFQKAVSAEQWQAAVRNARGSVGPMKSRSLKIATPAKNLPGAPEGEYVVMQFDASFERNPTALETVTVMREPDGSWRVVGYFVK